MDEKEDIFMKEKKISKVVTFMLMLCLMFTLIPSTTYASTLRMKNTNPEVYVGKTIQLKLLGTSKKAKWVSGNTSIATVNSKGLVKAKKPGYVTIRATVGNKVANAGVLVNKPKLNNNSVCFFFISVLLISPIDFNILARLTLFPSLPLRLAHISIYLLRLSILEFNICKSVTTSMNSLNSLSKPK